MMTLQITTRYRKAFTLVELMIVIVIVAIITSVAIPYSTNSDSRFDTQQQIANIKQYLHFCKQSAQRHNKKYRFVIDTKGKTFWMEYRLDDDFTAVPGVFGNRNKFSDEVVSLSTEGFDSQAYDYLTYDPLNFWPSAFIQIDCKNGSYAIDISPDKIEIKDIDDKMLQSQSIHNS